LPDGCRQVFNLYVLEDYSHKEIAESLAISESTSKSQYRRAKQLLKERITAQIQVHG
jgi:RNA polymerase sigma-70 factor (ECF subfamily)